MVKVSRRAHPAVWLLAVVAALASMSPARAETSTDVAVVVHPDVAVDNLTIAELRRVVLGDREFWPASVRITLLLRAPVAHERDVILKDVCQMTEAQFRQHWIGKVFRADTALAPKIAYSNEMAIDLASRVPGAIAFVNASQVGKGLKVVRIDGRLPGDKDYLLR